MLLRLRLDAACAGKVQDQVRLEARGCTSHTVCCCVQLPLAARLCMRLPATLQPCGALLPSGILLNAWSSSPPHLLRLFAPSHSAYLHPPAPPCRGSDLHLPFECPADCVFHIPSMDMANVSYRMPGFLEDPRVRWVCMRVPGHAWLSERERERECT